jgi:hypothetical protein
MKVHAVPAIAGNESVRKAHAANGRPASCGVLALFSILLIAFFAAGCGGGSGGSSGGGSSSTPTATTTTLAVSNSNPTYGASITLTATVSPSAATGTVTFYDGSTSLGTGTLSSGTATMSTSSLAVGANSLTAKYTGSSAYASSTSSAHTVTVSLGSNVTVNSGQTLELSSTTDLDSLTLDSGGSITTASGDSLTMTVNGTETGQELASTTGVDDVFVPGTYSPDVVLTVATTNSQTFSGESFPIRQALYVNSGGIVDDESVLAAATYDQVSAFDLNSLRVTSTGEDFNAVYAAGGSWELDNATISLTGNGRSDFAGYGTAIVADGSSATTTLVIDNATINNTGVVRNAIVSTNGANVVVKNSDIKTHCNAYTTPTLPSDYVQQVNTSQMRSVPWMLGINGTDCVRATNLLGASSKASYINSKIQSDGWGVLSTDSGSGCTLTAINSTVSTKENETDTTLTDGYGSYAIGNATEYFLGTTFNVGSYSTINTGGTVNYGDSTTSEVASLNTSLDMGLTSTELAALTPQFTTINSSRFAVMWHSSSGAVNATGGTVFNTKEAVFLPKTTGTVAITVDGTDNGLGGVQLKPANGIIIQVMDDDDPGPNNGINDNTFTELSGTPLAVSGFDNTSTSTSQLVSATFKNIDLAGDFYNGAGWQVSGKAENMAVFLTASTTITGVITSSEAKHSSCNTSLSTTSCQINSTDYYDLGEVTNTPQAAINNGTIVSVDGTSTWVVNGTSYLTGLTVASGAKIEAPSGKTLSMTVNGTAKAITPGNTYSGPIVLTLQ